MQFVAVARDGASFAGRQVLRVLETEAPQVAQHPALAALVFGQPGLASVLDDGQLVLAGNGVDRIHVAGHAEDMHGQDGSGAVGDPALDRRRVHGQRGRVRVGEHRQRFVDQDRVVGRNERVGRNDHLVAGIHAHDVQSDQQGSRAAGRRQAAFGAEQFRVGLFKLLHVFPAAAKPSAAAQYVQHGRFPGLPPVRPAGPAALVHRRCRPAKPVCRLRRRTPTAPAALSQVSAAEPAAACWINPRRVRKFFMSLLPSHNA